jgi:hypothetical protein
MPHGGIVSIISMQCQCGIVQGKESRRGGMRCERHEANGQIVRHLGGLGIVGQCDYNVDRRTHDVGAQFVHGRGRTERYRCAPLRHGQQGAGQFGSIGQDQCDAIAASHLGDVVQIVRHGVLNKVTQATVRQWLAMMRRTVQRNQCEGVIVIIT